MTRLGKSAAALAVLTLTLSQAAEAKKKAGECITEGEVVDLLRYSMPSVIEGVAQKCRERLSPTGFIATSADAMIARYSEGRDQAWPGARTAFAKLSDSKDSREIVDALNDNALQPLVSEAISELMVDEVKPESCSEAEHLLQATNNIAPENFASLLGALFLLVSGPKDKDLPICEI